jgi:hypothetical protein
MVRSLERDDATLDEENGIKECHPSWRESGDTPHWDMVLQLASGNLRAVRDRRVFDQTTYYYAACGSGNVVLSWVFFSLSF